jgi:hypothetical protein
MGDNTLNVGSILGKVQKRENRTKAKGSAAAAANAALGNIGSLFGTANTTVANAAATAAVNAAATAVAKAEGPTTLNVSVGKNKFKAVITKVVGGRRNRTNGGKRKRAHHKLTRRNKRRGTRRNKRN